MKNSNLVPILLVIVAATCALLSEAASVEKKVPLTTVGGKTFYIVEGVDNVNWEDAKKTCQTVGLVMSVVENKEESDALSAASLERAKEGKQHYLWLGAYLRHEDKKWIWQSTGQELTYTNWEDGVNMEDQGADYGFFQTGFISAAPGWRIWAGGDGDGYEFGLPVCQEP